MVPSITRVEDVVGPWMLVSPTWERRLILCTGEIVDRPIIQGRELPWLYAVEDQDRPGERIGTWSPEMGTLDLSIVRDKHDRPMTFYLPAWGWARSMGRHMPKETVSWEGWRLLRPPYRNSTPPYVGLPSKRVYELQNQLANLNVVDAMTVIRMMKDRHRLP